MMADLNRVVLFTFVIVIGYMSTVVDSEGSGLPTNTSKRSVSTTTTTTRAPPRRRLEHASKNVPRPGQFEGELKFRRNLGLFVAGEKLTLVSQSDSTPLAFSIKLPDSDGFAAMKENLEYIQSTPAKLRDEAWWKVSGLIDSDTKAYKALLTELESVAKQTLDTIDTTMQYIQPEKQVSKLPPNYPEFCHSMITPRLVERAQNLRTMLSAGAQVERDATKSVEVLQKSLNEVSAQLQRQITVNRRYLEFVKKVNRLLEALNNFKITPELGLLLQKNECIKTGAQESFTVKSSTVVDNTYTSDLRYQRFEKESTGYLINAINYRKFVSKLHQQYVQSTQNPALFAKVAGCTRINSGTSLKCPQLIWENQPCFTFAKAKNVEQVINTCQMIKPLQTKLQVTSCFSGSLVDNIGQSDTISIEGKLQHNQSVFYIPFSFSFSVTTEDKPKTYKARTNHSSSAQIRITWLTKQQIDKIASQTMIEPDSNWVDVLREDEYKIFSLSYQVFTLPFLINALYRILLKHCWDKLLQRSEERRRMDEMIRVRREEDRAMINQTRYVMSHAVSPRQSQFIPSCPPTTEL